MLIALWDTRKVEAAKDMAGGLGLGPHPRAAGWRQRLWTWFRGRDRRPVALVFAHLAAIFARLGHRVVYARDRLVRDADLYVFCPSLPTLHVERQAIARVLTEAPGARVLVVGPAASVLPAAFECPGVTVVRGDPEQLLWTLDEVLARPDAVVGLGALEELDRVPLPDWTPFAPRKFRIHREFWRFPTALVEMGRGCQDGCGDCAQTILEGGVRFRDPEAVVEEIAHGVARWGFRSFRFCDPCFGRSAEHTYRLVDLLGRLARPIQFSIETRPELLPPELLRALKRVGLTCVRVSIQAPEAVGLKAPRTRGSASQASGDDQRRQAFFAECRAAGVRTAAAFLIGFPQDTTDSIHRVRSYAESLNPTFAEFNLVAPSPDARLSREVHGRVADFGRPRRLPAVAHHPWLSDDQLRHLQAECVHHFYFRWQYLSDNASLLWPLLGRLLFGAARPGDADAGPEQAPPPVANADLEMARRRHIRQDGPHRGSSVRDDAA